MLRGGYKSVKESNDLFEEIPLRNTPIHMEDQSQEEPVGCFCGFTRIIRLLVPRKLFSSKQG